MKKIFTLLTAALLFIAFSATAQITEGFENTGGTTYLTAQGWKFVGATWNNTSQIRQVGSLSMVPTTNGNGNNITQVMTPAQDFSKGGDVSFEIKLPATLGRNSNRVFTVSLYSATATRIDVGTYTINNTTAANTIITVPPFAVAPTMGGNRQLLIEFTGTGDNNATLFFDNLNVTMNAGAALPVKLSFFKATVQQGTALLQWNIADNENANRFEVQTSDNGVAFTTTGMVLADEGAGSKDYLFGEKATAPVRYYRLKMWDREGEFEYSNVVVVRNTATVAQQMLQAWQPAAGQLSLQFGSAATQSLQLTIANVGGAVLHQQQMNAAAGKNAATISLNRSLAPGVYLVHLRNGNNVYSTKLLVP